MSNPSGSSSPVVGSQEWVESFPDGLYDTAREVILHSIEQVEGLDPANRRLIWDDGTALTFDQSVQRISASYLEIPVELVRAHLIGWLEMGELPGDLPDDQMDELDELATAWAEELNGFG